MGHLGRAAQLAILAVVGQGVIYFLTIVLARRLGAEGFEAYAVASAAFTLMVMCTPQGLEKYALRLLPALFQRQAWGPIRGYLQFSARRTLTASIVIGLVVFVWAHYVADYPSATRMAFVASCLSLPAGALAHLYVELLSAAGRDIMATAVFRVVVPTITLVLVGFLLYLPIDVTGAMAVGSWGFAWIVALVVMALLFRHSVQKDVWTATPLPERSTWSREARPFLTYRLSLGLLSQIGVIALDRLHPSATATGAYVAAMSTAGLAIVLTTSTNRYYSRQISMLLEKKDFAALLQLRKERLRWLLPTMAVFLGVIFLFGRQLLGFFRPEFADEGVTALRLVGVAATISVLFSLAPTYLKYMGRNRIMRRIVGGAALVQAVLLYLAAPRFAATGAAFAYSVSICGMYLTAAILSLRNIERLESEHAAHHD